MDSTWRTLKYDPKRFTSGKMVKTALVGQSVQVDDIASKILESSQFRIRATKVSEMHFEILTPRRLGMRGTVHHAEFMCRAEKYGVKPVQAYETSLLRLNYLDQPKNEIVYAGMDPIILDDGRSAILCLHAQAGGTLNLRGEVVKYNSQLEDSVKYFFQKVS